MTRTLLANAVLLVIVLVAVLLVLDVAYLMSGSLEQHPTGEQEDKVRVVTAAVAVLLLALEIGLLLAYRRLARKPKTPAHPPRGVTPPPA